MSEMNPRPKFWSTFFKASGEAIEKRGLVALVPVWLIVGIALGGLAAWFVPSDFWAIQHWGTATTVYTGFLAFNGLLLALGWGAFSKIYEILSTGWFAAFLRRYDLVNDHLFFVDLVHGILILAAFTSGCGLVAVLLPIPVLANQIVFALVVGLSFYALVKAISAMQMMNDLIWELAHSEPDARGRLRPVPVEGRHDNAS